MTQVQANQGGTHPPAFANKKGLPSSLMKTSVPFISSIVISVVPAISVVLPVQEWRKLESVHFLQEKQTRVLVSPRLNISLILTEQSFP